MFIDARRVVTRSRGTSKLALTTRNDKPTARPSQCRRHQEESRIVGYQNILYVVEDRVATITFNRPKQHNAFSEGLIADIVGAIAEADRDPEVRVIVVTGAGGAAF